MDEKPQHKKGTTTVGVICKDAVVLAADQLATLGDFKFNKETKKIFKIAENIAMTTAGVVGDNQTIVRLIKAQMALYHLETGQPTVTAAVTLLANVLSDKYQYSYLPYGLFDLVAGFDTQPRLFSIDPVGGIGEEKKYASTGSGMTLAYSILDKDFKPGMSIDEGVKLAIQAIVSARARISSVGGKSITVFVITDKGVKEFPESKVTSLIKK